MPFQLMIIGGGQDIDRQFVNLVYQDNTYQKLMAVIGGTSGEQFYLLDGQLVAANRDQFSTFWGAVIDEHAGSVVQVLPGGASPVGEFSDFQTTLLTFNSSITFYSCTNLNSPYETDLPVLSFSNEVGDCTKVVLRISR
jgi:hypothetical protein